MNEKKDILNYACVVQDSRDFNVQTPQHIEIGCGKGKFLLNMSEAYPDSHFLGIDWSWKWMKIGVERADKRNLKNIQFYNGRALEFLQEHIPDHSIETIHIYFPDPWPKKKHHKRRIFTPEFIQTVYKKLIPGGQFLIATDYLEYYTVMQDAIYQAHCPWAVIRHTNTREHFSNFKTNYEIKYELEGRTLSYISLGKMISS